MNVIIYQPWGGLGDNLQFSTLPELFSGIGYNVYISSENVVRNPEIFDLVWKLNPYVKGVITNDKGHVIGSTMQYRWPPESHNEYSMHRIEIAHGFPKTNFYPKIYFSPTYLPDYSNDTIIDLTGSSQVYELEKYKEYIDYFVPLVKSKVKIVLFEKIKPIAIFDGVYDYLKQKVTVEYVTITSLLNYCDIIKSCNTIIVVNSGINSLASAIKQDNELPNILCYNPWADYSPEKIKGCYHYKNVEYVQSKIL